jgi:putative peptidoglycan lipid II flippase
MQSLFRSFFTVSFYTILSRILGFIRDILIARFLGSTVTSDAFFVAFRIPNFFRRVLAEGAYSAALIPVFSGIVIDTKDDHEAADFVENTMSLSTICYGIFIDHFLFRNALYYSNISTWIFRK